VTLPRAAISWSSGKDSAFALREVRRLGLARVEAALTTINEAADRVAMHGTRRSLLDAQIARLGLPLVDVPLPWPCPNDSYEARMAGAAEALGARGITHVVFGDLFLEDIRAYREARMEKAGLTPLFPLWGRDTATLAREMLAAGLEAYIVTLDPKRLDPALCGRRWDAALIAALPDGVDPCGEHGEFHTAVTAAPIFSRPIPVSPGERVTREGFVYADLIPEEETT